MCVPATVTIEVFKRKFSVSIPKVLVEGSESQMF